MLLSDAIVAVFQDGSQAMLWSNTGYICWTLPGIASFNALSDAQSFVRLLTRMYPALFQELDVFGPVRELEAAL
jgi:hypothetical protein